MNQRYQNFIFANETLYNQKQISWNIIYYQTLQLWNSVIFLIAW